MSVSTGGTLELTTEQALWLLREMLRIRRVEEALARSYAQGLIPGACHTYVGQEAIAVGVCAHLRADDVVFSTHRGHGHALAKGAPAREVMAELFGKATGVSKGRGGSMHLFVPEVGLMGTTGIVGPNILQATGAGYSFQLMKTDQVSVAFFGDGAMNNGAFHEGVNLAAIWGLPVVYVCENNQFATEVPFDYATRNTDVAERARSYGIPGVTVDGNDVLAVTEAAAAAIDRARRGGGPSLIEGRTYRTRPHAEECVTAGTGPWRRSRPGSNATRSPCWRRGCSIAESPPRRRSTRCGRRSRTWWRRGWNSPGTVPIRSRTPPRSTSMGRVPESGVRSPESWEAMRSGGMTT
ncbi:MAG: thiamine pyrophosphate-dependent dehydrogenase E1 component subunit alpha [Thermomicrobiales bacterium]